MTRYISSTNNYDTVRNRMAKYIKKGINVVVIDTRMAAIVGNSWVLKEELVK